MNPMVYLILTAEREMEIKRQDCTGPINDETWSGPARQPVRINLKGIFDWLRPKQVCSCS